MKTYNKSNTSFFNADLESQLLAVSSLGDGYEAGSNGEYTDEVILGSRDFGIWEGEVEEDEDF